MRADRPQAIAGRSDGVLGALYASGGWDMSFATINGWTVDRMIERVRARNDGTRAMTPGSGVCLYRVGGHPGGNACALGCFIPDELYTDDLEGNGPTELVGFLPELAGLLPLGADGLELMQEAHDNHFSDEDMRDFLAGWIRDNVTDRGEE